jgi:uncharacterized protein YbjT (DUF2867 family)
MTLLATQLLLAGATGLVGGAVVRERLADAAWTGRIIAPVRRHLAVADPRLVAITAPLPDPAFDAELYAQVSDRLGGAAIDTYVSCLGTTLKTAGSKEAFIAVDRALVLRLASLSYDLGARRAILVSSVGASRQSANFYLRVKGEVEDEMAKIGFERLDILQPGLLLGARGEQRTGEAIAQALAPLYNPLLIGAKLRRYRAVAASDVAKAIIRLSETTQAGQFVHEHDAILALAGNI